MQTWLVLVCYRRMVSVSMADVPVNCDRYIVKWASTSKQMGRHTLSKEILKFWQQSTGHMRYDTIRDVILTCAQKLT